MGKGFICTPNKLTGRPKNSKLWKKLMSNKNVSGALNKKYEENAVYGKLKDLAKGGLYVNEVREFVDRLAHNREKTEHIDWKEARQIAKGFKEEMYPELKMYKYSKPKPTEKKSENSRENFKRPRSEPSKNSIPKEKTQITPVKMAAIMNKAKIMSLIIIAIYFLIILIFLAFGAAIVFHLLRYRINRQVAGIMSTIYIIGAVLLIISNFVLFTQVDWEQIFGGFRL